MEMVWGGVDELSRTGPGRLGPTWRGRLLAPWETGKALLRRTHARCPCPS